MLLQKVRVHSFLLPNSIQMCKYTAIFLFTHLLGISVDGHLGGLHILAIVNNDAYILLY